MSHTILIVAPDEVWTEPLCRLLQTQSYDLRHARRVAEIRGAMQTGQPHLAIVSASLPDGTVEIVRDLLTAHGWQVPCIDVVESADPRAVAEAVERELGGGAEPEEPKPGRKTCRGLIVDDEVDHCAMIEECFSRCGREEVEMVWAHSVAEACRLIEQDCFDFVLLDHNLPDGTGCDVLERMEERLLTTPVIGLSTSGDPQVALADFRGGALEFIQKHDAFEGDSLRRRVFEVIANHKRRIMASVMERRRRQYGVEQSDEALIAAARTDALLQIFNRATFEDVHADLHARSRREGRSYGLCLVDVDHFKRFNDRYGHASGDEVLKKVAAALVSAVRSEDFVARYGGEELVVLLDDVADDVATTAERLCAVVVELHVPHELNDEHGRVTVSVGAAVFDAESAESQIGMLERADAALYRAKATGRNRAVVATSERVPSDREHAA